ncbi:MAG: ROK family transcriptional regulator [Rhizobiaceae bacterium]
MRDEKGRVASASERQILDIIHRSPGISRSALTKHTRYKQQSVHRMVDSLAARKLLQIGEPTISGRGKPSPALTVNPRGGFAIGISVNTDAIRLSVVNLGCELIDWEFVETDPTRRDLAIQDIVSAASSFTKKLGIDTGHIIGYGVAITGFRMGRQDVFMPPLPLKQWSEAALAPLFTEAFGHSVWIENNANAGAIAESLVGAGRQHSTFCYLSFNYGFGGGMIVDGEPLVGAHGNAGELGTMFRPDQRTSRPALEELIKRIRAAGGDVESIRALIQQFHPDLPGVRAWVEEVMPMLELTIRAISATMDPSAIVFGGEAPPQLQQMLIDHCKPFEAVLSGREKPARPVLLKSAISGDPATFGAALLPIKQSVLL